MCAVSYTHLDVYKRQDVLGVATSMYNMYETRQRRMYVETFATLCSYFGVSADDLLGTGKEE